MNKEVELLLNKYNKLIDEWKDYFSEYSTITHLSKCRTHIVVDNEKKKVTIWCNNHTEFSEGYTKEYKDYKIDDWDIRMISIHSVNNLTCLRACELW